MRAAIARALIDRGIGALFPAVKGALAVGTPVRGWGGPMTRSELRQEATNLAEQLAGLATVVEVEKIARRTAMSTATAGRQRACTPSPYGSQASAVPLVVAGAQLPPVLGGLGARKGGGLSERSLRIDVEIAVVRMLLAKVVAGLRLRLTPGENLFEFVDELLQVLAGKFPAEPEHQSCYLAHGGESLGNLAGSLVGDFGKRDFTAFLLLPSSPNPQLASAPQACKIQRCSPGPGGESTNPSFPQQFNQLSA